MSKQWLRTDETGRVVEVIDFDPVVFGDDGVVWYPVKGKETTGWIRSENGKYSPPETQDLKQLRRTDILVELQSIDARSSRAMRESMLGSKEGAARLDELEAQAAALRVELAAL